MRWGNRLVDRLGHRRRTQDGGGDQSVPAGQPFCKKVRFLTDRLDSQFLSSACALLISFRYYC